jgi:hypothetical protein
VMVGLVVLTVGQFYVPVQSYFGFPRGYGLQARCQIPSWWSCWHYLVDPKASNHKAWPNLVGQLKQTKVLLCQRAGLCCLKRHGGYLVQPEPQAVPLAGGEELVERMVEKALGKHGLDQWLAVPAGAEEVEEALEVVLVQVEEAEQARRRVLAWPQEAVMKAELPSASEAEAVEVRLRVLVTVLGP